MMRTLTTTFPLWPRLLLAPAAGALLPLSLAPYNVWLLGLLSIALLALLSYAQSARRCALLGFGFGLGLYGTGASWVYVSISQFGGSSNEVALVLTSLFVVGLALVFAIPLYAYGRWLKPSRLTLLWGFAAIWVLGEWMRSWFLTGFPWLYAGYGHLDTWLAGWAPTLGVFGVSLACALTACALVILGWDLAARRRDQVTSQALGALLGSWLLGAVFTLPSWTQVGEQSISVGMAQGNIPQERKWDPTFLNETFRIFHGLSEPLWDLDWVIWPEAAIPLLYHHALGDLESINAYALTTDTVFITGILYDQHEPERYYNSLVARGQGSGIAFKTRLVPFGEYVPLERWLRGLINFFDLPTSIIHPGPRYEGGLQAKDLTIAPSICYEVVYPDLVAARAAQAEVLLTVSNDAWFGASIGPVQHFEMARMRALETGRYMVRATNNGISGIIDHRGQVVVTGGRFTRETITGNIHPTTGNTPFVVWRSWPVVLLCFGMMGFLIKRLGSRSKAKPQG